MSKIEKIEFDYLREKHGIEGLVFFGAGGKLTDWTEGITEELSKTGIINENDADKFFNFKVLNTSGGRQDLVFIFKTDAKINISKLAIWRLQFGDCSWISDYITNYASQHGFVNEIENNEMEDGNE